jgi:dTDP-glucose pyrophosphorylase/predicted SnoaL-like aldol condensation-catalyzing enzyme
MMNIVIPMAGRGSRFANAGFVDPKPLIKVGGKPMIQWVIENVRPARPHRFTFIVLREHLETYPAVAATLRALCPGCSIVTVDAVTEGAACTVLLAKDLIDNDEPLMIANADQFVDLPIDDYLAEMERRQADGLIMTFEADHPKWSYCRLDPELNVTEVVEKKVVSNEATVGIYNFRRGKDFVRAAEQMIAQNLRSNGEFYVAPAYNLLIAEKRRIAVARTGQEYEGMYGLGVPEDLAFFLTTQAYERGRVDAAAPLAGSALLAARTRHYVTFFHQRNLAGVRALLTDDFALEDPVIGRIEGKEAALGYIAGIFREHPQLRFSARQVVADGATSAIEFELQLGERVLRGVDIIEWQGDRIKELRAHLR